MRTEIVLKTGWKFSDSLKSGGEKRSCPEETMKDITVPHDWAVERPLNKEMEFGESQGFFDRAGLGWYRNHLVLNEIKKEHRYYLIFDGVYENASVWMNEKLVGTHRYGYSGFKVDVTDCIAAGENLLAVSVDNQNSHPDRWYSGAGIYRRVKLEIVPVCCIIKEEMEVWSDVESGQGNVRVRVPISESDGTFCVAVEVSRGDQVISKTEADVEKGVAETVLTVKDAVLWDADNPQLYKVSVCLRSQDFEIDCVERSIGFRTVHWSTEQGMTVNGKTVKLKGVCLHHEAGCLGAAVTAGTWKKRLDLLKDMGCNAIRTSHNIPDEILLDLCDTMGFYVLEEFTDKWKDGSYGRFFEEDWKEDLDYMLKRDRHRASVVMWSVGNEVDRQGSEFMLDILKMLVGEVKRLDQTRPVTCALSPHFSDNDGTPWLDLEERLDAIVRVSQEVDILGLNYQEQWYELLHERIPQKLILGTEIYMFFKGHEQQYMNYSMDTSWMDVEKHSYVPGGFVWAGIDYLGESMGYPSKGWGGSLIKTNLVKKPVAYLWESYWSEKPMVYFAVQDYTLQDDLAREHWSCPRLAPHWNFEQYGRTVVPYMIFTNCEEAAVYINGVRYYVKTPGECEGRIITGFLPYVPGTVRVAGIKNGEEVCEYEICTAGAATELKAEIDSEKLKADVEGICHVLISAVDKNGNVCFKENALVHVKVEGPAEIAGVDNGDLMDSLPYHSDSVRLHWGKAAVILKSNGEPGRITLSVRADGFTDVHTVIIAE